MYERDTPRSKNISTELRQFYFGDQPIGPNTYDGLAHVRKLLQIKNEIITFGTIDKLMYQHK